MYEDGVEREMSINEDSWSRVFPGGSDTDVTNVLFHNDNFNSFYISQGITLLE